MRHHGIFSCCKEYHKLLLTECVQNSDTDTKGCNVYMVNLEHRNTKLLGPDKQYNLGRPI